MPTAHWSTHPTIGPHSDWRAACQALTARLAELPATLDALAMNLVRLVSDAEDDSNAPVDAATEHHLVVRDARSRMHEHLGTFGRDAARGEQWHHK
jgi:hypothetical protein